MTRAARHKQIVELRAKGFTNTQIGALIGVSYQMVRDVLYDPDGSKTRARKDSYRGVCLSCGAPTNGSGGPAKAPSLCAHCAPGMLLRVWTEETIIAAIRRWADEHGGRQPSAAQWLRGRPVGYPPVNTVQKRFGSWAAAIAAAGFGPLTLGRPRAI